MIGRIMGAMDNSAQMKRGDKAIYRSPLGDVEVIVSSVIGDCAVCTYGERNTLAVPLRLVHPAPTTKPAQ